MDFRAADAGADGPPQSRGKCKKKSVKCKRNRRKFLNGSELTAQGGGANG